MTELREDYWWIDDALAPLRGQMVPMDGSVLEALWKTHSTAGAIRQGPTQRLGPIQLEDSNKYAEQALGDALVSIGVMEVHRGANQKINVPDIFRVEAGIKRKGGVRPPKRPRPEHSQLPEAGGS